ncbi:MAG TPA: hypothetical protein VI322_01035 [Candidatus Saccharimonadia bacterium]
MRNPVTKVVIMQWVVIAALVVGSAVGIFLLVNKVNDLSDANSSLLGDQDSLRRQVKQYREQIPSPTPTPVPTLEPTTPPSTPTPAPKR